LSKTIAHASELKGIFPAIFTPLKNDDPKCMNNSIDYEKAKQIIDDLIKVGVQGVVPMGTTGQSATVSPEQHIDFIQFTLDYVDNRIPVIAGAGSNSTRESVETIQKIQRLSGELTFLCVTGYYNNPPQEGLTNHFTTLVEETGANIVLYNVPARTNSYLTPESILKLAEHPRILGLKQAVDFQSPGQHREDTLQILKHTSKDSFAMFTGEDDALATMLELGGTGMITATGNIPEAAHMYLQIIQAFEQGNKSVADSLQKSLLPFVQACFIRKNPIPLGTLFNSPVYQPLIAVQDTEGGRGAHQQLMQFIDDKASSLTKYHQM
jgi:4-hydroxy-tetrahydrodipicolinate synthase